MTTFPAGIWRLRIVGRYLRPDGSPIQGYLLLTPPAVTINSLPGGAPFRLTVQTARLDIDKNGYVAADIVNPNDPSISPGPSTGNRWAYQVLEVIQRGHQVAWWLEVPADLRDGETLDLGQVPRLGEEIVRPADWWPHHMHDTPVQAGRISPRNGPLMRKV